jgi:ABC-type sulfate transport system permease component
MFAGNLQGVSQTVPLAVYLNLEGGAVNEAVALSLITLALSLGVVFAVRSFART